MPEFWVVPQLMFDGGKNEGSLDVPQAVTKYTNLHIKVCFTTKYNAISSRKNYFREMWREKLVEFGTHELLFILQVVGNFVETLWGNCVFPQTVDTTK